MFSEHVPYGVTDSNMYRMNTKLIFKCYIEVMKTYIPPSAIV